MLYLALLILPFVGSCSGDIIVHSRELMALQNRTVRISADVLWCELFYADDFPDNTGCENSPDGQWHTFPACCNGAYNCLGGGVWDMMLCPAEFVYNSQADECLPYTGTECPPRDSTPGNMPSTVEPPVSCGTVRNGKLPYAPDCTKYILCVQEAASLVDCPDGYVFYVPFLMCLPGEAKQCKLYQLG